MLTFCHSVFSTALFAHCHLQQKHYPDPKACWQDDSLLKYPSCCFTGTEWTCMSSHTQMTVCGPHSGIYSQLFSLHSWISRPFLTSMKFPANFFMYRLIHSCNVLWYCYFESGFHSELHLLYHYAFITCNFHHYLKRLLDDDWDYYLWSSQCLCHCLWLGSCIKPFLSISILYAKNNSSGASW